MDRSTSIVGEGSKVAKSISKLFPGNLMDRKLLRPVVQACVNVKGMDYEAAHAYLYARAEKIGFEQPDHTPDWLLTLKTTENRRRIAKDNAERKILKGKFVDDDGKGESPDIDDYGLVRSHRGGR